MSVPMLRASTRYHRRASTSPPRNAATPTMPNSRPKDFALAASFSTGRSGAGRRAWPVSTGAPEPAGALRTFGAAFSAVGTVIPHPARSVRGAGRESGMCRASQQAPTTARTSHATRLGRFQGGRGLRLGFIAF